MSAILDLTSESFTEIIDREGIVLIDAWASWCGPCRMFAPVFEKAADQYPQHTFAKLNTETHAGFVKTLAIEHIPTLLIYRDGILLYNKAGSPSAEVLADIIGQVEDLDMDNVRADLDKNKS